MNISQVMTRDAQYIPPTATLEEAARKMKELGCGFLPIGSPSEDKLRGVVTDRDIVVRALAQQLDPADTTVDQIKSDKVLYCYENDDIEKAVQSMHDQQVYRLVVLNNPQEKRLCGIVSLGDITRHEESENEEKLAGYATKGMKEGAH